MIVEYIGNAVRYVHAVYNLRAFSSMIGEKNIVATELLSVKDKVSLVDVIAFSVAGDHTAGLAGALMGASFVPSKLIYSWRVLYDDETYGKMKLKGDDSRNNIQMNRPCISDCVAVGLIAECVAFPPSAALFVLFVYMGLRNKVLKERSTHHERLHRVGTA